MMIVRGFTPLPADPNWVFFFWGVCYLVVWCSDRIVAGTGDELALAIMKRVVAAPALG